MDFYHTTKHIKIMCFSGILVATKVGLLYLYLIYRFFFLHKDGSCHWFLRIHTRYNIKSGKIDASDNYFRKRKTIFFVLSDL